MKTPIDLDDPRATAHLPPLTAEQQAHTTACATMLRDDIAAHGGWLSFARFMERALYAPGLGYYAAGARKFGASGDFVTAPEISPLFGRALARSLLPALQLPGAAVLELGPGSGKLAEDMLQELAALGTVPREYLLLEVSAELAERQRARLHGLPASLAARCRWISSLPPAFTGAIIANEVLDVVPVHVIAFRNGRAVERGVSWENGAFVWRDAPDTTDVRDAAHCAAIALGDAIGKECFAGQPPQGYVTEVSPQAAAWTGAVLDALQAGVALFVDYGFRRAEYYHPDRTTGTLMCHYRHFAHPDPFRLPGLQDITAHVDFSLVADAGSDAGASLLGYSTQAQYLLAAGIADALIHAGSPADLGYLRTAQDVQRLLSPAEMGELFKVVGFGKDGIVLPVFEQARPLPL